MKKLGLLLGMFLMMTIAVNAQDTEVYQEQAQSFVAELQAEVDLSDETTEEFTSKLAHLLHKADYIMNSGEMEGSQQEATLKEVVRHYEEMVKGMFDADVIDDVMSYSAERLEFLNS